MNVDGALRSPSGAVPVFLPPDGSESFFPASSGDPAEHTPRWPSPVTQPRRNDARVGLNQSATR